MRKTVNLERYELIWDLKSEAPELYKTVLNEQDGLESALTSMDGCCPVASTVKTFQSDDGYFRLTGHARSFCLKTSGGGVVAIKGAEPASLDYMESLHATWKLRPLNYMSRLEHFVMFEHEVYLALTLDAALSCARVTQQFTTRFHHEIGRLPRAPIPLQVFRIPESIIEPFLDASRPYLSDRSQFSAWKYTQQLTQKGLGVYVYAYPNIPIRLAHHLGVYPGAETGTWDVGGQQPPAFDAVVVLQAWTQMFADMLRAGYLPTTCLHTGNCFQPQNLAIDGGICDIDSVEPIEQIHGERDLLRALIMSLNYLVDSATELLRQKEQEVPAELVTATLWQEIQHMLRGHELQLDPRLRNLFKQHGIHQLQLLMGYLDD